MARNVIVINVDFKETRVALIEDGVIAELQIERAAHRSTVGNIVLGKVTRVLPGMQAAFIDVGQERAAFLHVEDLIRPDDFDAYLARDPREGEKPGGPSVGTGEEEDEGDDPALPPASVPHDREGASQDGQPAGNRKRGRHRGRPDKPQGHRETLDFPRRDQARRVEPVTARALPTLADPAEVLAGAEESAPETELPYVDPPDGDLFDASEIEFEDDLESGAVSAAVPSAPSSGAQTESDRYAEGGAVSGRDIGTDASLGDAEDDDDEPDDDEPDDDEPDDDDETEGPESDEPEDDDADVEAEDDDDDEPDVDEDDEVVDDEAEDEDDDVDDDVDGSEDEDEDDAEDDDAPEESDDEEDPEFADSLPGYSATPIGDGWAASVSDAQPTAGEPGEAVVAPRTRVMARRRFAVEGDETTTETDAESAELGDASMDEAASAGLNADPARRGRRRRRRGGRAGEGRGGAALPGAAGSAPDAALSVDAAEPPVDGETEDAEGADARGKRRRRRGRRRRGPEVKAPVAAVAKPAPTSDTKKLTKRLPARVSRSVPISEVVREGDRVVVQISKEPIGTKGARVTSHVSLPGRYVVYLPTVEHVGISKRIGNSRERSRLRQSIEALKPKTGGLIVRTVAEGLTKKQLKADVGYLIKVWAEVAKRRETAKPADVLYEELDLVLKAARDLFTDEVDHIIIDDREQHGRLCRFVEMFMPGRVKDIKLYTGEEPMFDAYGIEDEIKRALSRKVPLASGGSLIVDQAEALTAIDVNTGRYVGKGSKDLEETALKTNLEAVDEIAYQLRFRNLGGLVILDLIDMERAENRERVWRTLEHKLAKDKAKTTINRISDLGLIEMTRKRTRESLGRIMHEPCFYCDGTGHIQSRETVSYEILRQIRRDRLSLTGYSVRVHAHPAVIDFLKLDARDALQDAERRYLRRIELVPHQEYHIEQYDLQGR